MVIQCDTIGLCTERSRQGMRHCRHEPRRSRNCGRNGGSVMGAMVSGNVSSQFAVVFLISLGEVFLKSRQGP
jgi:hypothetical protein